MQVSTAEFRKGLRIVFDGDPYTIVDFQHVEPGKGGAFVRTKLKHMKLGKVIDNAFRSGEKVELVDFEEKHMQFLYRDDRYHFMDLETYEQVSLSADEIGDAREYLQENAAVDVLYVEGAPVAVELPNFVELAIAQTDPGLRIGRATGGADPGRGGVHLDGDHRGADGRDLLPGVIADRGAVRGRGRPREGGTDPLHHRGDEAHERDRVEGGWPDRQDLRRERAPGRVRSIPVPDRSRPLSTGVAPSRNVRLLALAATILGVTTLLLGWREGRRHEPVDVERTVVFASARARDSRALAEEAVRLYAAGQFPRACEKFGRAAADDPGSAARRQDVVRCFEGWGWQALREGRPDEAGVLFRPGPTETPDDPALLKGLGLAAVHAGRPDDAFPPLEHAARAEYRSEERRVGKECRSRWSPYH